MNLVRSLVTIMSCSVIILAAGSNGGSNGSGGSDGGMGTEVTGTIEQVNPNDSMLVITSEEKLDTVYVTEQTQLPTPLEDMTEGDSVKVEYEMMDNQKIATSIEKAGGDGGTDGSMEEDTIPQDTGM